MPTIEVTDEQLERLEAVRADVEEALAGPYGTVPTSGAVEYLLDTYTPPQEADGETAAEQPGENTAAPRSSDPESAATDAAGADNGLTTVEPIGSAKAAALERSGFATVADLRAATIDELTEVEGIGETLAGRILTAVGADAAGNDAAAEPTGDGSEEKNDEPAAPAASGTRTVVSDATAPPENDDAGGNRLNTMMNLLDEHDDKWAEASGDEPYEVELPDGSTETARTKDDVRGLLFRHYR